MTLKTNRLRQFIVFLILGHSGRTGALDVFECVRDLMPITEASAFQSRRQNVERPFMVNEKFMVFPEIGNGSLRGFYIYSKGQAKYYDSIQAKRHLAPVQPLAGLSVDRDFSLLEMVVQPFGLETVMLRYLPGFGVKETTHSGPVMLGSSILPVVGALVSRSDKQLRYIYNNPDLVSEMDIKQWIFGRSARRPADVSQVQIRRKMLHLGTLREKDVTALWQPLHNEFKIRKRWVQEHNLNESAFKHLSRLMETTCKE